MSSILSRKNRRVLAQFAASNVLLAFDYDGTLAPLVAEPSRAVMRGATQRLLEQVSALYPCVVISGRATAELSARLNVPDARAVGNHGIESLAATATLARKTRRWRSTLERLLWQHDGIHIEDKGLSVAIDYRRSREKKKARAAILRAATSLGAARIIGGKLVINLVPEGAPHKGIALERERDRCGCDTAIYVGDDDTDEDVFALEQPGRLLKIRVGFGRATMANYAVRSQGEIDTLLRTLIELRTGRPNSRRDTTRANGMRAPAHSIHPPGLPALGEVLDFLRLVWALDYALQRTSRRMEATLGVTGPQRLVIRMVGRFPGIPAGEIARILHVHPATLTGILQRLERDGVLARQLDPRDRRRALFGLTARGATIDSAEEGTVESAVRRALADLSAQDVKSAGRVLAKLTEALDPSRRADRSGT